MKKKKREGKVKTVAKRTGKKEVIPDATGLRKKWGKKK